MSDATEYAGRATPPAHSVGKGRRRIAELARSNAGLLVREQDLEALSSWAAQRVHKLALAGIEQFGELLAEDSALGR